MDYQKEIDEILYALEGCDYNNLFDGEFYNQVICPFKFRYKKPFCYDYGATKGVIMFKDLGFVIKIPFTCSSECEFLGAECSSGWDYCEVEKDKYLQAKENNLKDCFAETKLIGFANSHPIYIQEYVNMFLSAEESTSNHTKEDEEIVTDICEENDYECFNKIWLSDVFSYFGENIFYKLMNFIHDAEIRDLHGGNLGYIGMRPVLVDYSSYNE